MEKKEYLNEENYEKGKKKLIKISLIILICGLLIGGGLIITGIIKTNIAKNEIAQNKIDREKQEETEQQKQNDAVDNEQKEQEINKNITDTKAKITAKENEIIKLEGEQQRIFQEDKGFSERYYTKKQEINTKENELTELRIKLQDYEFELSKIKMNDFVDENINESIDSNSETAEEIFDSIFSTAEETIATAKYTPYYMIGGFIIIASCIVSFAIFMFAKKREITAFTIQQSMPVAQEAIDKMAPTIGNAAGTIGKDMAKGITSGIKEGKKDK